MYNMFLLGNLYTVFLFMIIYTYIKDETFLVLYIK